MKKILLIGSPNEVVKNLYESLTDRFYVQLCFGDAETMKKVARIVNPDMIVINQFGETKMEEAVHAWLIGLADTVPLLFITVGEYWNECGKYWEDHLADKLFSPVTRSNLTEKCTQMLKMNVAPEYCGKTQEKIYEKTYEKKRIMIIDDSPLVLRSMKTLLQDKYTVFLATGGEQAVKLVPSKKPDLIFLDYEMPGWDGKKTYEAIKELEGGADIPVIFLTSVSDKEHISAILETKPVDYILKPPDQDRLLRSIEEVLMNADAL